MEKKGWVFPVFIAGLAFFAWFFYWKLLLPSYFTFSDTAKFADIARNYITGKGFAASFSNFGSGNLPMTNGLFPGNILPLYPFLISFSFLVFGISDFWVVFVSGFFYVFSAVALYLLGRRLFGSLVGFMASLVFLFDPAMLTYATSGASESLFIFELVLAALLICVNTRLSLFFSFLVFLLMYLTRPSAILYIVGFVLFFIFLRLKKKDQIIKAVGLFAAVWLLAELILAKFSGKFFLYSPVGSFLYGTAKFSPLSASTETLRGGMTMVGFQLQPFLSKFFYNLYNFYKLLPQILSPYLATLYVFSFLRWEKEREKIALRGLVLFFVLGTFFAAAATLPIYRYLHPVIPFVYLLAIEMLVWIVSKMVPKKAVGSKLSLITNYQLQIAFSLVLFFIIGQTLGKIFLDSRFLRDHANFDKPPVYVKLSLILKENTKPSDLVITNLDTWGTWYGERKTIWYPLEPKQLIPDKEAGIKVDAIYLTSYKMDDENYYMGNNWRKIFFNPENIEEKFLVDNFKLEGKFEVKAEETFGKEGASAILLVRK